MPAHFDSPIQEALWWKKKDSVIQCTLCPWACILKDQEVGKCHIRAHQNGKLVTLVYGTPSAVAVDPIEKKPVFHLLPGTKVFSIATVGCNLRCSFCQNWDLSQAKPGDLPTLKLSPEQVVEQAIRENCASIAYTYSEPMVFYEYVYDTAQLAKAKGLRNVIVSAGYVNFNPLKKIAPLIDVMKVDLKSFDPDYYRAVVGAELKFVLATLKKLKHLHIFTEVVNLIVPGMNDDQTQIREMCRWIVRELGPDTPLFFTRFFPQHFMKNLPPTPIETLRQVREIGIEEGLNFVYTGNVPGDPGEHTYCPACKTLLIERRGYEVLSNRLHASGRCPSCQTLIPGIWAPSRRVSGSDRA